MPVAPVAGELAERRRDLVGRRLDLLQADDVRLLAADPLEHLRLARADAVDVPGRDLHGAPRASARAARSAPPAPSRARCGGRVLGLPEQVLDPRQRQLERAAPREPFGRLARRPRGGLRGRSRACSFSASMSSSLFPQPRAMAQTLHPTGCKLAGPDGRSAAAGIRRRPDRRPGGRGDRPDLPRFQVLAGPHGELRPSGPPIPGRRWPGRRGSLRGARGGAARSGGYRYRLAPWEEGQAIRRFERYDEQSEQGPRHGAGGRRTLWPASVSSRSFLRRSRASCRGPCRKRWSASSARRRSG